MDGNTLLTIVIGLGVPLIIFFITYKKTVGASKEREKTAYREIVSLIAKLIAHEEIKPNFDIINGLIKSKAREHNVNLNVSYISTIFEDVMAKFIENEFISSSVKNTLIDKVQLTQKEIFEAKETKEATVSEKGDLFNKEDNILTSTLNFSLIALLLTIPIIIIIQKMVIPVTIGLPTLSFIKEFGIAIMVSMVTIVLITMIFYSNIKEEMKSKERKNIKYGGSIFEDIVFEALKDVVPIENIKKNVILNSGGEVDFLLISKDENIPIEVKYHTVSLKSVKQFKELMIISNYNKAILITNSSVNQNVRKFANEKNIILIDKVQSEEDIEIKLTFILENDFAFI